MGDSMSSMVLSGDTSGTVTVTVPAVAGTNTVTIPAATGTVMVSGNMPSFSASQNATQSIGSQVETKIQFNVKDFDTNTCYSTSNYRFTPTVAGYYQISAGMEFNSSAAGAILYIYKNGSNYKKFTNTNPSTVSGVNGSAMVYCNGSTDYVEIYGYINGTSTTVLASGGQYTWFQGVLVRAA